MKCRKIRLSPYFSNLTIPFQSSHLLSNTNLYVPLECCILTTSLPFDLLCVRLICGLNAVQNSTVQFRIRRVRWSGVNAPILQLTCTLTAKRVYPELSGVVLCLEVCDITWVDSLVYFFVRSGLWIISKMADSEDDPQGNLFQGDFYMLFGTL